MRCTPAERRQIFVKALLADPQMHIGRAYEAAGFKPNPANANRLFHHPEVQAVLTKAKAEREARTDIVADKLLVQLNAEAFADQADLYDEHNRLKPIREWPLIWRQGLVAGIEVEELFEVRGQDRVSIGFVSKIKLADRTRIKKLLGDHVNVQAFKEKAELDMSERLVDLIVKSMQPRE